MTGVPTYLVDTSVLLRFFVQGDPEKSKAVKKLVQQAGSGKAILEVPFVTVSETVHTLRSVYKFDRSDIAREVLKFLQAAGVELLAPEWLIDALRECQRGKVSFGDACIAAEARKLGRAVASFDRDFDAFDGIMRFEPK